MLETQIIQLQIAIEQQKQLLNSTVVPNYTSSIRTFPCCGRFNETYIRPPENRCCSSPITDQLEIEALRAATYNQYAPKYSCCQRRFF